MKNKIKKIDITHILFAEDKIVNKINEIIDTINGRIYQLKKANSNEKVNKKTLKGLKKYGKNIEYNGVI